MPGRSDAADAREVLAVEQQRVDERAARVAGGRMDDEAGRLVDHDQVARPRGGSRAGSARAATSSGSGARHHDLDRVALADARAGLGRDDAAERDVAVVDQALDLRARQLGDRSGDHGVEPAAGLLLVDHDARSRSSESASALGHQIFDLT